MGAIVLVAASTFAATASGHDAKSAAAHTASAPPLMVGVTSEVATAVQNLPQVFGAANAAARYINLHGGLGPKHQKVDIVTCNGEQNPNDDVQCATTRQLTA